jgi:L-fucose mutarotase
MLCNLKEIVKRNTVLKGIDPILTPELLMHLSAMGHGEWVAVVDANFTADYLAQSKPVIRLPGLSLARVSQAVLSVFPLAEDVPHPVAYMHVCHSAPEHRTAAQQAVVDLAALHQQPQQKAQAVERFAFYEKVKTASLIVQTGEGTAYGNALFCKGVILLS